MNKRYNKITNGPIGHTFWLFSSDHNIHKSAAPINDIYWYSESGCKALSMDKFRFVEYNDYINHRIFPFKKE